ncbi:thiamine biosynthesis protein ApbE [Photobacterium proteolyticum]|uniref:FAD:protein FMN transferase n=1 Tax=Photobacterium proteolyticum TaxID=1903952 RepID=A0A1Q9GFA2_9GAMM|nr:FAD:protein FMN transferase [Photobacterium proteolyticum]OLQ72979.1 thiamine biosynthesis protein ApbE [Photobacterium proteolyticum]
MSTNQPFSHRFMAMTVPCEVMIFAPEPAQIAQVIEVNTRRLESKFNFYDSDSVLSVQINQRKADSVEIDDEMLKVLTKVREHSIATNGIFDITIGTVKAFQQPGGSVSREKAYQFAQPYMGLSSWSLEESKLNFACSQTRIDLGGVIKEVAVDQAIDIATKHNASGVLINFGGDIRVSGVKPDGSDFVVAVLNPKDPSRPIFALPLRDQALTTSAHYARRYQFSDQETSHILSEQGTHRRILSSTVVAETALQAGIFSTSLTIDPRISAPESVGFALVDDQLTVHQDIEFLNQ